MRSSTLVRIFGILAVAIIVGGLIGWWASRDPSGTDRASQPSAPITPVAPTTSSTAPKPPVAPEMTDTEDAPEPEVVSTNVVFDPALWEDRLDEILGDPDDDTDRKANELLDLMDKVSVEAQKEIADHVVNLANDEDFAKRAAKYLTNAAVPEAISSIFMDDLYNRDDLMKLPLLLAVARNEKHALRDEAKDLLELYVEEDYGTNWVQWEAATKKYIKENGGGEEEPAAQP